MKKIVILGNGFDLAHNLPTKYSDFIKYLIEQSIQYNDRIREELIDVGFLPSENQAYEYIKKNYHLLANESSESIATSGKIEVKNKVLYGLLKTFFETDWVNIEDYYFQVLHETSDDQIDQLNQDFDKIKEYLSEYLKEKAGYSSFIRVDKFKRIFMEGNPSQIVFVNFNYTNTIKHYFSNIDKHKMLINIHGELGSKQNPIVFGYGDSTDSRYLNTVNKNNNDFTRNLKRLQYNLAAPYEKLNTFLTTNTDNLAVYIIGHSLGLSDKTLLREIMQNSKVERIKIYYHKDIESFRNLNSNLSRIVSESILNDKVVNFTYSEPIPQLKE